VDAAFAWFKNIFAMAGVVAREDREKFIENILV